MESEGKGPPRTFIPQRGKTMARRVLKPPAIKANGSYSPGWEVSGGRLIHVAGQLPWDANGEIVAKGDVVGQTRQVFANIAAALVDPDWMVEIDAVAFVAD
jgi:enamine deaminase RidA (YjgF/YER057c/UK114 family)